MRDVSRIRNLGNIQQSVAFELRAAQSVRYEAPLRAGPMLVWMTISEADLE
jgi:hypothetical protein